MDNFNDQQTEAISPYTLFMIFLNLGAVAVAILSFDFFNFEEEFHITMKRLDSILSIILLADFIRRFSQVAAKDRRKFLFPWGIIDFLGSLPVGPYVRVFRLVRIFRLVRFMRQVGWNQIVKSLRQQTAASSLWGVIVLIIPMILISGWWVTRMESSACLGVQPDANICSVGDGIWWALVTVTTVGYGEFHPVSTDGRILAGVLMTVGVGMFGLLSSYLATTFIRQEKNLDTSQSQAELLSEVENIRQELAEIKALLSEGKIENRR